MRTRRRAPALLLSLFLSATVTPAWSQDVRTYKTASDVVAWVYRDFAYQAIFTSYWKEGGVAQQPLKVLQRYFTDELAALLVKDRECSERTHEICNLDWDPIFASQDPGAVALEVSKPDAANIVRVEFGYPNTDKKAKLAFHVQHTSRGWRISDIVDEEGGSLRKVLGK
jgi:hypothetical protein